MAAMISPIAVRRPARTVPKPHLAGPIVTAQAVAAVALDPSTPPSTPIPFASSSVTSTAFNPPSNSIIEAVICVDGPGANTQSVVSMSNMGAALTWRLLQRSNTAVISHLGGSTEVWWAYNALAQTGMTVTANFALTTTGAVTPDGLLQMLVFTGAAADQTTAASTVAFRGNLPFALPSATVTTSATGSVVWGAVLNYTTGDVGNANNGQSVFASGTDPVEGDAYWVQQQAAVIPAAGTPVTIGDSSPAVCFNMVAWEVLAGLPGGPVFSLGVPVIPAGSNSVSVVNTFGKNAAVTVSGPAAIYIDGVPLNISTGTVIVPAGHTISLAYLTPPTWVWVLF